VPTASGTLILLSRDPVSFDGIEQAWTSALASAR
jgi:hypothetical protein